MGVWASCKSHQIARGHFNDEDTGQLCHKHCGYKVAQGQNTSSITVSKITCKQGASYADTCLIASDFTWDKQRENERIRLVRGKEQGRKYWLYVFLHDDEETEQLFEDKIRSGNMTLTNYGCVFKSGWGKDPPEELQQAIARRRDITKHTYY